MDMDEIRCGWASSTWSRRRRVADIVCLLEYQGEGPWQDTLRQVFRAPRRDGWWPARDGHREQLPVELRACLREVCIVVERDFAFKVATAGIP